MQREKEILALNAFDQGNFSAMDTTLTAYTGSFQSKRKQHATVTTSAVKEKWTTTARGSRSLS